jgi:hypothetical protein
MPGDESDVVAVGRGGHENLRKRWAIVGAVRSIVSHPAFLLLTGAVISGLLIPSITQRWQNHQKELDVKSRLVSETSHALATYRGSIQRIELAGGERSLRRLDGAFADWGVRSAVIRSELQAYFGHNKRLLNAWDNFDTGAIGAYYVLKNDTRKSRLDIFNVYRTWLGKPPPPDEPIIYYSLKRIPNGEIGAYDSSVNERLLFPLLHRLDSINRMILAARSKL